MSKLRLDLINPLYCPWQEPIRHRTRGGIKEGRRPSVLPHVNKLRERVGAWRRAGYPSITGTTRRLLEYWFEEAPHRLPNSSTFFQYHWGQREAIETIIYLYEALPTQSEHKAPYTIKDILELLGDSFSRTEGIDPAELLWPRYAIKLATGTGKTKVMSLAIVWHYFNRLLEGNSNYTDTFVIIAPNVIVYERLCEDFADGAIFQKDPVIPPEWRSRFDLQVILRDDSAPPIRQSVLYLTNIQRLYPPKEDASPRLITPTEWQSKREVAISEKILGPEVRRSKGTQKDPEPLLYRIARHKSVLVLNDEAHHLHDPNLAWNRTLAELHKRLQEHGAGICLQLDFTATPRHTDGSYFKHVIVDFPLGEAVDAGIVKVPLLGESPQLEAIRITRSKKGDPSNRPRDTYRRHLEIAYEVYERSFKELEGVQKPILFVMTEDTKAADDIADFLNTDRRFKLLNERVLNLHTRLKGKIQRQEIDGKVIETFVPSDDGKMSEEDLRELRKWSRELDSPESPYRCVVSVLMLREGWDIRNVTVIVPLRAYSAKAQILPEQTLGRGLRRMFPIIPASNGNSCEIVPETVVTIEHPAFQKLYQEELEREGLPIGTIRLDDTFKESVTIYADPDKSRYDISIPRIFVSLHSQSIEAISIQDIRKAFEKKYPQPLPIRTKSSGYREIHMITQEEVRHIPRPSSIITPYEMINFYAQVLGYRYGIAMAYHKLGGLIEDFLSNIIFGEKVDLFDPSIRNRIGDPDVEAVLMEVFNEVILSHRSPSLRWDVSAQCYPVSSWQKYQVKAQPHNIVKVEKTVFNLVPCDSSLERDFAKSLDRWQDVLAFARNHGPDRLWIEYLDDKGILRYYAPDFIVRAKVASGEIIHYLVETKGQESLDSVLKAIAAKQWCETATKALTEKASVECAQRTRWEYVYVTEEDLQNKSFSSFEQLVSVSKGSLNRLLKYQPKDMVASSSEKLPETSLLSEELSEEKPSRHKRKRRTVKTIATKRPRKKSRTKRRKKKSE